MELSYIVVAVLAILLSAFFSALEIAFNASDRLLLNLKESENHTFCYIRDLFRRNPSYFLSSVLVGNTLSLIVFAYVVVHITTTIAVDNLFWEIVITSSVVVVVAEFIPRVLVSRSPAFFLRALIVPAFALYVIFYPITKVCGWLSWIVIRLLGRRVSAGLLVKNFDMEDLQSLVEEEIAQSTTLENEMRLLHNAFDFSHVKVRDCMIPRVEIEAFDIEGTVEELSRVFISTKFSRIPIYRDTVDTIVGYASSRQLFEGPETIESMLRVPLYVPSSASAQWLFEEFIRERTSMAIVIDEFGSTAGLITSEDILEEIFGEIDDEHDTGYFVGKSVGEGEYLVAGRAGIEEISRELSIDLPQSDDYETLAGCLLYAFGDMPEVGDSVEVGGYSCTVERISQRRISLVRIKI